MKAAPQIFLGYVREDRDQVEELYEALSQAGFEPWMDVKHIMPGEKWESSIREAICRSDLFLALLSENSVNKIGFFQKELRLALDIWQEREEGQIYLIPVRLEDCEVPETLRTFHWVDLFRGSGWDRLLEAISYAVTAVLEQLKPPDGLVEACLEGNCVLFGGPALSESAGLPRWEGVVRDLLKWSNSRGFIDERSAASLKSTIDRGDLNSVVDSIVSRLQEAKRQPELIAYLRKTLVEPQFRPTQTHRIVRKLGFSAALTTNYDELLECAYEQTDCTYTPWDTDALRRAFADRQFFILKLRGTLDRPETILLTPAQYKDMIMDNRAFAQFMSSLFVSRTILFLGVGLDDIPVYLEGIRFREAARRHYALVPVVGSAWETEAEQLKRRYNIQVLPYRASDPGKELEFLQALAQRLGDRIVVTEAAVHRPLRGPQRARLRRIQLENIGPFDELELDLDPQWNVLLGDNGVGKSTLLRAITLAICGEDAREYASRLIKFGDQIESGRIILETTQGERYVANLQRAYGEIEVVSLPGPPLQLENWLVLGFPPLRGLSWQQSRGPQPLQEARMPAPTDLLPLLASGSDPRINELQQWIVNLDYRVSKMNKIRDKRLLDDFFQVVDRLTEDVTFQRGGVDPQTYQVTVITDDGEVPIEVVSQGTQSLIGWVGVLLERLHEVYNEADQPKEQPALVLIDEIDAHMHPAWQQLIVPSLTEIFPNVQFIATTHSPHIVAELERDQIFVLRRDPETTEILVGPAVEDVSGLRADQILTSSLFGLTATRGSKGGIADKIARYSTLLGKSKKTPSEQEQFEKLQAELQGWLAHSETPVQRQIEKAIRGTLAQMSFPEKSTLPGQIELPPDVELEVRRQLAELLGYLEEEQ